VVLATEKPSALLSYFVFHTVLVSLEAENHLTAETLPSSLGRVWLKFPPLYGINRNSND
jgi:hypothetical protein